MNADTYTTRMGERGSALVIAVLVMVILTLLGISFLMMAETENRIAENERRASQALYAAETGVKVVKRWFDRPGSTMNVRNPGIADVDRTLRMLDLDGDPSTAPVAQTGSGATPRYKQGVDVNTDGNDDIFRMPYRGNAAHALLGTAAGPDMRMVAGGTGGTFLNNLSDDLFGSFPGTGGLQARITQIDVYAPPYIQIGAGWTRYGMGTVAVTAQIQDPNGEVLSERVTRAVLNEMPYPGPFGPLHSCDDMSWNGEFTVYWGVSTAVSESDLTNLVAKIAVSWPRDPSPSPKIDLLYGVNNPANWNGYMAEVDGEVIEDPWFRHFAGGTFTEAPNGNDQPWTFNWNLGDVMDAEDWPNQDHGNPSGTRSNIFQNNPTVACPPFDYKTWKGIATSGASDVHYYVWDNGSSFRESGYGAAQTYRNLTDQVTGLFFFDTADGAEPRDNDSDGDFDNLTPAISMSGGNYQVRGMVYLNADAFGTTGLGGRPATFSAPGEPYRDDNLNGRYDAGEAWVNMVYPTTLAGDFTIDTTDAWEGGATYGAPMRNSRGPEFTDDAILWGILYNTGTVQATGNATFYGSLVAKSGLSESGPSGGTPQLYWDQTIQDAWPPESWDLPRVTITRWEVDLRD